MGQVFPANLKSYSQLCAGVASKFQLNTPGGATKFHVWPGLAVWVGGMLAMVGHSGHGYFRSLWPGWCEPVFEYYFVKEIFLAYLQYFGIRYIIPFIFQLGHKKKIILVTQL